VVHLELFNVTGFDLWLSDTTVVGWGHSHISVAIYYILVLHTCMFLKMTLTMFYRCKSYLGFAKSACSLAIREEEQEMWNNIPRNWCKYCSCLLV
jgi:hypothetical protein